MGSGAGRAANAALEALCRRLIAGEPQAAPSATPAKVRRAKRRAPPPRREFPAFPREEPGQRARFWAHVVGWLFQSGWVAFLRLPKLLRVLVYLWLAVLLLQRCSSSHHQGPVASTQLQKVAQLARVARALKQSEAGGSTAEAAKILAQLAKQSPGATHGASGSRASWLVIPFTVPPGNVRARNFARTVFGQVYGQLALMRPGEVVQSATALTSPAASAAAAQGRADHSRYILYGGIRGHAPKLSLALRIASANALVLWAQSYPVARTSPARIAADVASEIAKIKKD